jgi:hypothetical protein
VDLIERPVIIRWFALMFTLGAWAGTAFVALRVWDEELGLSSSVEIWGGPFQSEGKSGSPAAGSARSFQAAGRHRRTGPERCQYAFSTQAAALIRSRSYSSRASEETCPEEAQP